MNYDTELSTVYPIYHSKSKKKGDAPIIIVIDTFAQHYFYWQFTKTHILLELFFHCSFITILKHFQVHLMYFWVDLFP